MTWNAYYQGDGVPRDVELAPPPPWRRFPREPMGNVFQAPAGLTDVVNAALCLRRPLLITGAPGSGKSTVIESVAAELKLGAVLRWHITSRSSLQDALYRYDVLGRIHAQQLSQNDNIDLFLRLGPLGTALMPAPRPRALLIDEIDKSDLDLAGDLLDVLERGEFTIDELIRYEHDEVDVRPWDEGEPQTVTRGKVQCTQFPFIVMTSNGERDFPAPFLRRCIRYAMPTPTTAVLTRLVGAHLGITITDGHTIDLIQSFHDRLVAGESLAVDQLLSAVFLLTGQDAPAEPQREAIAAVLLRELSRV